MIKPPKPKLENLSVKKFGDKVSRIKFEKMTHKDFRTKESETIDSNEVWKFIKNKIEAGDKGEGILEKRIAKELKLKYNDVDKVVDTLRELIMPTVDDKDVESKQEIRNKMIQEIIASVQAEEEMKDRTDV